MKFKVFSILLVCSFLAVLFGSTVAPAMATHLNSLSSTKPAQFASQVRAACGSQPDVVSIKLQNQNTITVTVTGEIWAQPQNGQAVLISSVPSQFQQVSQNDWGGPEDRLENHFPTGFTGTVWGWAEMRSPDGTLLGGDTLSIVPLTCGTGTPTVGFSNFVLASCVEQPDQVEVRLHNDMLTTVVITGEIWAQPDGGQPIQISLVPPAYQDTPPNNWGGPEERIGIPFPAGFSGMVWGFTQLSQNGQLLGGATLGKVHMVCDKPTSVTLEKFTAKPSGQPNPIAIFLAASTEILAGFLFFGRRR